MISSYFSPIDHRNLDLHEPCTGFSRPPAKSSFRSLLNYHSEREVAVLYDRRLNGCLNRVINCVAFDDNLTSLQRVDKVSFRTKAEPCGQICGCLHPT